MKKFILLIAAITLLCSCEDSELFQKKEKKNICPIVTSDLVPGTVTTAFTAKYSSASAITWFDKDGTGYCAIFTFNGSETKAFYDKTGNFVSEEVEQDGDNNNHDNDSGCECELVEHD
jgi:hypothetical protein